jgi:Phosphodiester glycosidase
LLPFARADFNNTFWVIRTRRTRVAIALGAVSTAVAALAVGGPGAGPAAGSTITFHYWPKHPVVRGIEWQSVTWTNRDGYQHAYVMSINLNRKRLHIRPGMGHGLLDARETVLNTARRIGAVGGINGDTFSWSTSMPSGGIGANGTVFKTPDPARPSQLYVTAHGKAGIGSLKFSGSVTKVTRTGQLRGSRTLKAINTPHLANTGHLTLFTSAVNGFALNGCKAVSGPLPGHTLTVRRVYRGVRHVDRLRSGRAMVAACGTAGHWLLRHARLGHRLRIRHSLTTTSGVHVESFISGVRTLRSGGHKYLDSTGFRPGGINPEAAACVSQDRLHVKFIAVDGRISAYGGGTGVTITELRHFTAELGCYSAVMFDGGGSTTLVGRKNGAVRLINQTPKFLGQRPVPDGLYVVRR